MKCELFHIIEGINECERLAVALAKNAAYSESCGSVVEPHTLELSRDAAHLRQKLQTLIGMQVDAYDREKGA